MCPFERKTAYIEAIISPPIGSKYIIFGFSSILFLRLVSNYTYLLVFIGAWVTDVFAYFTGKFFGKRKLCEEISPKKTIAGSIGGTLFCIIAFVSFGYIVLNKGSEFWKYAVLACLGLIIAVVSQVGDLSMSLIKRRYGIKDFGKVFPGHGGVLDRFDSIIAVSSILFIMLTFLKTLGINILI
jgi:phosphatidate cytidylyltransferase